MKTNSYSKNIALAAVAGICVATFALGAQAAEVDVPVPTRTVQYADLNLDTQAGVEKLYQRIRGAADQVCGNKDPHQLLASAAVETCVNRAVSVSVRAVNNPRLTSAYDKHFGVARTAISVASLR
jgi:UrcA family protein